MNDTEREMTMKANARKTVKRTGGDRLVVLTNGREYVHNFNTCFGIIVLAGREGASVMTLANATEVIKDIGKYGAHKLWAELVAE